MQILRAISIITAGSFFSTNFWLLMSWCDAARTTPVFEGIPSWFYVFWFGCAVVSVLCFIARLRIVSRIKVERVSVGLVRGRKVREVVVEG